MVHIVVFFWFFRPFGNEVYTEQDNAVKTGKNIENDIVISDIRI